MLDATSIQALLESLYAHAVAYWAHIAQWMENTAWNRPMLAGVAIGMLLALLFRSFIVKALVMGALLTALVMMFGTPVHG